MSVNRGDTAHSRERRGEKRKIDGVDTKRPSKKGASKKSTWKGRIAWEQWNRLYGPASRISTVYDFIDVNADLQEPKKRTTLAKPTAPTPEPLSPQQLTARLHVNLPKQTLCSSMPWSQQLHPTTSEDLLGNRRARTELDRWLNDLSTVNTRVRVGLLHGRSGVGKRAAAQIALATRGWQVIEHSVLEYRTPKDIRRLLHETCCASSAVFKAKSPCALILSDLELLWPDTTGKNEQKSGVHDLTRASQQLCSVFSQELSAASGPVILLAKDGYVSGLRPLRLFAGLALSFEPMSVASLEVVAARVIQKFTSTKPSGQTLVWLRANLCERVGGDARRLVNVLQFLLQGQCAQPQSADVVAARERLLSDVVLPTEECRETTLFAQLRWLLAGDIPTRNALHIPNENSLKQNSGRTREILVRDDVRRWEFLLHCNYPRWLSEPGDLCPRRIMYQSEPETQHIIRVYSLDSSSTSDEEIATHTDKKYAQHTEVENLACLADAFSELDILEQWIECDTNGIPEVPWLVGNLISNRLSPISSAASGPRLEHFLTGASRQPESVRSAGLPTASEMAILLSSDPRQVKHEIVLGARYPDARFRSLRATDLDRIRLSLLPRVRQNKK